MVLHLLRVVHDHLHLLLELVKVSELVLLVLHIVVVDSLHLVQDVGDVVAVGDGKLVEGGDLGLLGSDLVLLAVHGVYG